MKSNCFSRHIVNRFFIRQQHTFVSVNHDTLNFFPMLSFAAVSLFFFLIFSFSLLFSCYNLKFFVMFPNFWLLITHFALWLFLLVYKFTFFAYTCKRTNATLRNIYSKRRAEYTFEWWLLSWVWDFSFKLFLITLLLWFVFVVSL